MHTTPVSLLKQLSQAPTAAAWERFVRLYTPLLFSWARRFGLQEQDAADLVQEVLIVLVRKVPELQYDPSRSFRTWMRTVLLNKWRDRCRRAAPARAGPFETEPAAPDELGVMEEQEYRLYVVGRALRLMQSDFEPSTWKACWETTVGGRPVREVAEELGLTVNAVHLARSRVMVRLRCELAGLLD